MARPRQTPKPIKKDGFWYFIRLVPPEYAAVDPRKRIVTSTNIRIADDPLGIAAQRKVDQLFRELNEYWMAKRDGREVIQPQQLEQARSITQMFSVPYMPAKQLVEAGAEAMAQRLLMLKTPEHKDNGPFFRALLGDIPVAEEGADIPLSKMIEEVEKIEAIHLNKKSPNQLRKWRNAKQLALKYFRAAVVQDKTIRSLNKTDVRNYRLRIQERILDAEITIETGNKYINRVASLYKTIKRHYQLDLDNLFADMTFPGARKNQRVAFDPEFIQNSILVEGLFDDLNPEARAIVYLMVETGLRPSEACNLLPEHILLSADIPHVAIQDVDDEGQARDVKSPSAVRTIPLVGCALMAMKAFPEGFPRYRDKEDALSALLNKAFRARGLLKVSGQTLYSLRHAFKDRLIDVPDTKDSFIDTLMGHARPGPKYGKGYTLAFKHSVLEKIAFTPPSRV